MYGWLLVIADFRYSGTEWNKSVPGNNNRKPKLRGVFASRQSRSSRAAVFPRISSRSATDNSSSRLTLATGCSSPIAKQ